MTNSNSRFSMQSTIFRLVLCTLVGIIAGCLISIKTPWEYMPLLSWDIAAAGFLVLTWTMVGNLDSTQTKHFTGKEDPGRAVTDILLILASIASLVAVGILLFQQTRSSELKIMLAGFGMISIVISWAVIHTIYALRYARMYYLYNGGIDFNDNKAPAYIDFAYLAFTVGMTFQISDNDFKTSLFRRLGLKHALLSYMFGTVIVAATINLLAGLFN